MNLGCPECALELIIAEAEFAEEPTIGWCPECDYTEVVKPADVQSSCDDS